MNDGIQNPVERDDPHPDDGGSSTRRAVVQGIGVTIVAGAAGYAGFAALGPESGRRALGGSPTPDGGPAYPDPGAAVPATLVPLSDVPPDGGLVLEDLQLVVTRRGEEVQCFTAVCTHQGCVVTGVSEGEITCPCHGSAFDAATGEVIRGPAAEALAEVAVVVSGDQVVRA